MWMDAERATGAARRSRGRRLLAVLRHQRVAIAMDFSTAANQSRQRTLLLDVSVQGDATTKTTDASATQTCELFDLHFSRYSWCDLLLLTTMCPMSLSLS